jgi:hypothetical protein
MCALQLGIAWDSARLSRHRSRQPQRKIQKGRDVDPWRRAQPIGGLPSRTRTRYGIRNVNMQRFAQSSGITLTINLEEFVNPDLSVTIGSKEFSCLYSDVDIDKNCVMYFTLIVTDLSGKVTVKSDPMRWLAGTYQLDSTTGRFDFVNSSYWVGHEIELELDSKPQEMAFIVYDIGNLVGADKKLQQGVAVMEYFLQNVTAISPNLEYQGPLSGVLQDNTKLSLTYQLTCNQQVYGEMCDMKNCKSVKDEPSEMYCQSQLTGEASICYAPSNELMGLRYADGKNCTRCPPKYTVNECSEYAQNGESNDMYLSAQKTAKYFRTATIVLGVFLGIVLLLLIALIVFVALTRYGSDE